MDYLLKNAVNPAHHAVIRNGIRLKVCDLVFPGRAESWESYFTVFVREVCAYVEVCAV